ncbi:protein kinase [Streptomyces caniferus]|uniref:serine/threonine protein kinase n=1 Tax=Streptomyces caniferus TaxID=285557 RepID=UPI00372272DB
MTPGEPEQGGADEERGADGASGSGGTGATPPGDAAGDAGRGAPGAAAASGPRRGHDADLTGRLLGGRYRVTGRIGRGGMGVVCRAVDEVLGREVAVKVLRAYTDASAPELADLRTRMQREARAAARIRHSGVVTVHDVIDEDGRPVIVMELVDGPSLDDVLDQRGPLAPREIARIGAQVMDALDAAHRAGVLHRDVKPGNVLLDNWGDRAGRSDAREGRVVLTDFGIASIEAPGDGATTHLTRSGELVGSLDYLPPERAQGQDPTPASDIWSLGMTLYAAVEGGGAPFRRTSVWSTLTAIVTEALPEPRRAGPLTPVLHALMAKNPADRPTAARARSLLEAVAEGRDPGLGASYLPTATDVRALAPPPPLQEPSGPAADAASPPPGWRSGSGSQGVPETGPTPPSPPTPSPPGHPGRDPHLTPPSSHQAPQGQADATGNQAPGYTFPTAGPAGDPPGVVAGPSVGGTGGTGGTGGAGAPPYAGNPAERDTERVPARGRRRVGLAVAAVLAVLAAGGGVTYALVGGGPSAAVADRGRQSAPPAGTPDGQGAPGVPAGKDGDKAEGKSGGSSGERSDGKGGSMGGNGGKGTASSASDRPSGAGTSKGQSKTGATGGSSDGSGGAQGGTDGGGGDDQGGTSGGSGGGSGGGDPTQGPSCASIGGGKANCEVWRTASSYDRSFRQVGTLNSGTNYFYCQTKLGHRETYGKWTNVWWARTDDDSGNSDVYVSVVYLKGGANDQPVPGLPTC